VIVIGPIRFYRLFAVPHKKWPLFMITTGGFYSHGGPLISVNWLFDPPLSRSPSTGHKQSGRRQRECQTKQQFVAAILNLEKRPLPKDKPERMGDIQIFAGLPNSSETETTSIMDYRLVNSYIRAVLVLHFSKRVVLLNCF
jgi:hypothetical protein